MTLPHRHSSLGIGTAWAAILMLAVDFPAVEAKEATPERQVLERAIRALGGRDNVARLHAASWKFTSRNHGPEAVATVTGTCIRQGAEQLKREGVWEAEGQRVPILEVLNGKEGWVKTRSGEVVSIGAEEDFAESKANQLYLDWIATLLPLEDKAYTLSAGGEAPVGGKPAVAVLVSRKDRRDVLLHFDKQSGLLVKSEIAVKVTRGKDEDVGKLLVRECYYSDYKESQGVKYASKTRIQLDYKLLAEVEITDFATHKELDESTFAKP